MSPEALVGTAYDEALALLADRPLVVLTGAGVSTDSGIPDYRGPGSPARRPMTIAEFLSGPAARQRYWARSHLGWGRMRTAEPNRGHRAVAALDPDLLITQNVDGLHERAGSRRVVALHGRICEVTCLGCHWVTSRAGLQHLLERLNPGWAAAHVQVPTRPDGDVDLEETDGFRVPSCARCDGILKPHVVFFGENVPRDRVVACFDALDRLSRRGGALLVAGSSLSVMSGLRFVRHAAKIDVPVVIVNRGETRGDPLARCTVPAGTSEFLADLAALAGRA
ncbi:MAG: Sir2 family NAD-dependent protein deacetylase [Nocardioides sp.]|uniref:Sir2 family NAD-dependent protein deacetylase n=1 Tax=Nocardioides sp. TaxID=35761 RepID=UPI0039E59FA3